MDSLETLQKKVSKCKKCPLHKTRKNAVFGEGPKNARVMLIGEAPGAKEDSQGKPFVGTSGNELSKMLQEVGINREEVFITNTVKCRPPENRNPKEEEMECCSDFLAHQIEIINPDVICATG